MDGNKLFGIALCLAGALCCTTCAPVDPPTQKADAAIETGPPPQTEVLPQVPTPAPAGPKHRIEAAIQNVRDRDLLLSNGFWTVFHGILGLGPTITLRNPDTGEKVNAVDYLCDGG